MKVIILLVLVVSTGCKPGVDSYSDNLSTLGQILKMDKDLKIKRWEIFSTPEYKQGVPGPADYVSFVAEAELTQAAMSTGAPSGTIWIAPEAARSWMAGETRAFFTRYRNQEVDISLMHNCRSITGQMVKTNKPVRGLVCRNASTSLVYFVLADQA